MDLDMFNYGLPSGSQVLATKENYNTNQANVQGESLAPTPPANGANIAVDNTNDTRTAIDIKRDAQQANLDTKDAYDNTGNLTGSTGYQYKKTPDSKADQLITGIIAYGTAYLSGANDGQALQAMGQAVNQHIGQIRRQNMIGDLEKKGYNPVDIDKWIQTGDSKDLLVNKGKWNVQDGFLVNDLTGERKAMELSEAQKANFEINQAQLTEQQRHNQASEGLQAQGQAISAGNAAASRSLEQQRLDLDRQGLQMQYGAKTQAQQEKEQKAEIERNTQVQAVATNAQQYSQMGKDIMNDSNSYMAGSNIIHKGERLASHWFGSGNADMEQAKLDNYNHLGTTLGNAALYQEAGGKRIFSKELENSGKSFIPLTMDMNAEQRNAAILHNNAISGRFQQAANLSKEGKPLPNASDVNYGETSAAQSPSIQQPGVIPQKQGAKDFSHMW